MRFFNIVKAIQRETDLRLIVPFGLALQLGDVISVGKDGGFTLDGSAQSVLGLSPGKARPPEPGLDFTRVSGKETSYAFRAVGEGSALFQDLPKAAAVFDIQFGSAESWLLAVTGRSLRSLDELDRFRKPILEAYARKVWRSDWALVTGIATADRMTLLASRSKQTHVAVQVSASVQVQLPIEVQLTSRATVAATNQELVQCITKRRTAIACTALRVRDKFLRKPQIGKLRPPAEADALAADEDSFWEDVDDL